MDNKELPAVLESEHERLSGFNHLQNFSVSRKPRPEAGADPPDEEDPDRGKHGEEPVGLPLFPSPERAILPTPVPHVMGRLPSAEYKAWSIRHPGR